MKKHVLLVSAALLSVILLAACTGETNNTAAPSVSADDTAAVYKTISPAEAKELLGDDGAILVDVRTQEEYDEGYIPGAVLLPLDDITQKAQSVLPDKDATIIIYCRSGRRSALAADELLNMGYKTVYDLGGIIDWPYEVITN